MITTAKDLIQRNIPTVSLKNTAKEAKDLMQAAELHQITLVNNDAAEGIIFLEDISQEQDFGDFRLNINLIREQHIGISSKMHIYDVFKIMTSKNLEVIPVLDEQMTFIGCIKWDFLMETLSDVSGIGLPGSIIVLRVLSQDYSMAEIARICEGNDCKLLNLGMMPDTESSALIITIKVNKMEIGGLIAAFERHEYEIVSFFGDIPYQDYLKDRYDQLMRYLDL